MSNWSDLARDIAAGGARILGGFLTGGPIGAGAAALSLVATEFGVNPEDARQDPEVLRAAIAADPNAAVKLAEIEARARVQVQELQVRRLEAELAAETKRDVAEAEASARQAEAINKTIRAELVAGAWRSGWRPFFGYIVALSWAVQMLALGLVIVQNPTDAPGVISAVAALSGMWAIALAVLGVAVKVRSDDKRLASGHPVPTTLEQIGALFGKKAPRDR